jgi:AraC-like DNA-binding protein
VDSTPFANVEDWAAVARQCHYRSSFVAKQLKVSLRTLERLFRTKFNISPQRWFNGQRELEIEKLARAGARTKEIAVAVDLAQPSYLCRIFKRRYGADITAFRKSHHVAKR